MMPTLHLIGPIQHVLPVIPVAAISKPPQLRRDDRFKNVSLRRRQLVQRIIGDQAARDTLRCPLRKIVDDFSEIVSERSRVIVVPAGHDRASVSTKVAAYYAQSQSVAL